MPRVQRIQQSDPSDLDLQMTVPPHIVVSLVGNLGGISWRKSKRLLLAATSVLALLLALGVLALWVVPLAFPECQAASFFTTSLVEPPDTLDREPRWSVIRNVLGWVR